MRPKESRKIHIACSRFIKLFVALTGDEFSFSRARSILSQEREMVPFVHLKRRPTNLLTISIVIEPGDDETTDGTDIMKLECPIPILLRHLPKLGRSFAISCLFRSREHGASFSIGQRNPPTSFALHTRPCAVRPHME